MSSQRIVLSISGMHCASCAKVITQDLLAVPQVKDASVDYDTKKATMSYEGDDKQVIIDTIKKAGYDAVTLGDK